MTNSDHVKARFELIKLVVNAYFVTIFVIIAYYINSGSDFRKTIFAIIIFGISVIIFGIIYGKPIMDELKNLPETTYVKGGDSIILNKDEKFKIVFEKDESGNIVIRRG